MLEPAVNAAIRVHSTRTKEDRRQLLLDLSKADGIIYFCPEMSMILAEQREHLPRELRDSCVFLNFDHPTVERPWTGDDLLHIYRVCNDAASRMLYKRHSLKCRRATRLRDASPNLFLTVCGNKDLSRFAAQLIILIQRYKYTGPQPEDAALARMAKSLADWPPFRNDDRRVPDKKRKAAPADKGKGKAAKK